MVVSLAIFLFKIQKESSYLCRTFIVLIHLSVDTLLQFEHEGILCAQYEFSNEDGRL